MKDLIILVAIISFWFLLFLSLGTIASSGILYGVSDSNNVSFDINENTTDIRLNFTSTIDTDVTPSKTKKFLDMATIMFTFRVPEDLKVPVFLILFISTLNYVLLLLAGLIVYRLIRHGGG